MSNDHEQAQDGQPPLPVIPILLMAYVQAQYDAAFKEVQPNGSVGQAVRALGDIATQMIAAAEALKYERDSLLRTLQELRQTLVRVHWN